MALLVDSIKLSQSNQDTFRSKKWQIVSLDMHMLLQPSDNQIDFIVTVYGTLKLESTSAAAH